MGTHPIFESDFDCLTDFDFGNRINSRLSCHPDLESMLPRTRKRREPGWGDAAKQVLETVKYDMDVAEILEQIGKHNIKTVRGSIDDRDALRRVLEQTPETFYAKPDQKYGLTSSNRRSAVSNAANGSKRKNNGNNNDDTGKGKTNGNNGANAAASASVGAGGGGAQATSSGLSHSNGANGGSAKKLRKDSSERVRKISTDDLLSPETPLIGVNFKDFINEDKFSKLGVHLQWELMKLLPACDVDMGPSGLPDLGRDCFSNEFFNRALTSFPERITDGEFTPAMKARVNIETSRRRIDPWKEKFFEEYWGQLAEQQGKEDKNRLKWEKLEKSIKKELKSPIKLNSPKRSPKNSPKRVWSPSRTSPNRSSSSPKSSPKKHKKDYPEINRSDQTVIKTWDAINAVRALQTGTPTTTATSSTNQRDDTVKRAHSVIKQQPLM